MNPSQVQASIDAARRDPEFEKRTARAMDEHKQLLARLEEEERAADTFEAAGGVALDEKGKPEEPIFLQDIGIVNRRTARANGLRNPKRERRMAVPKGKRR